ncbi:MAG: LCP family protein [Faecalibacillus sp.]
MGKIFKDLRTYFMLLLGLDIVWFLYQVIRYPILPTKYIVLFVIVLFAIVALLILSQYKAKGKKTRIAGKVLIILLCLVLIPINYTYSKTMNALNKMVTSEETEVISVIVKKSSSYEYIEDLKGKTFSTLSTTDKNIDKTIDKIEKGYGKAIDVKTYYGVLTLVNALYSGEVDCIVLNESYRSLIEEDFKSFSDDTKVIYFKNYTTKLRDPKNIDITQETFSVYISGIDTYGTISTKSRSDVNMIITVNPTTKRILLTSIPRDYYIPFQVLNGQKDKLTHSGLFGVNETKDNVANYFGIDIDYFVRVNFDSVIDIVDALGGIDVHNPRAFGDFKEGLIHLNGEQALAFSRERHAFAEGDKERGRNQMRVITGIINKAMSPAIITGYMDLLNSLHSSFQTDISDDQIISFIRMQIDDMSSWDIQSISVDGTGSMLYSPIYGSQLYMMVPDNQSVETAKGRMKELY